MSHYDDLNPYQASPAEVAIAWQLHKDFITAPIASATTKVQVQSLAKATGLKLSTDEMKNLDEASTF
ncbi:aldo/keto reductase [Arenibacter lacus]|uniref:aldo/keto reductase n=1 Tax=Arenibacter lacus TaxID=2608629 RepID=UPI00123CFD3F|nr:aldo/keto reductase [Arenibacter lacus]